MLLGQKSFRWPFPHFLLKYHVDRAVGVCIWYGDDAVMQGVSQHIGHGGKVVMESYNLHVEMDLFPDSSVPLVFMVEVLGV